jgi:hypothetical protein
LYLYSNIVNNWLGFIDKQNLEEMTKMEFLSDIENMKAFAMILQGWITGKSNSIINKLGLLDLKLKEQKVLEDEVSQVSSHPGDLNSNAGNNLIWKERLEDIVNNVASVHSEFDVNLHGICDVIKKVDHFIDSVDYKVDPKTLRVPGPETQYYPQSMYALSESPEVPHTENNITHHNGHYIKQEDLSAFHVNKKPLKNIKHQSKKELKEQIEKKAPKMHEDEANKHADKKEAKLTQNKVELIKT